MERFLLGECVPENFNPHVVSVLLDPSDRRQLLVVALGVSCCRLCLPDVRKTATASSLTNVEDPLVSRVDEEVDVIADTLDNAWSPLHICDHATPRGLMAA